MSTSRKTLFSLFFSISALALTGCGGGNDAPAAPATPGNCQAGFVYSPQYGCMNTAGCPAGSAMNPQNQCVSVSTAMTSCQQTNQGPMVYAGPQYGCLPQGNCPAGQGAYYVNNMTTCIPAQSGYGSIGGCPVGQVMTEKGCLPQGVYPCNPGEGFLSGRCFPSAIAPKTSGIGVDTDVDLDGGIDVKTSDEFETDYAYEDDYSTSPVTRVVYAKTCAPKKIRVKKRKIKIKYPRGCRIVR